MNKHKNPQLEIKEKSLEFAREFSRLYFEKRDLERMSKYMEERITWIGSGENEISRNLTEAKKTLRKDKEEYSGSFSLAEASLEAVPFSDNGCIVYGWLKAMPHDPKLEEENMRFTLVLEEVDHEMKVVHMHFSHADITQEKGRYFVSRNARRSHYALRSDLITKEHQIANLTKNIPGGVHQCLNDSVFTLISTTDGFSQMFGYTRKEIETLFHNQFINMIYSADRDYVLSNLQRQLCKGNNIELEYRVLQKNGSPMWVLDKGRLLDDGNGRESIYSLLVEITDRKEQEEKLRLSLESHKIIMDQVTNIIFEWDILKDTLTFSPNWVKKFGYKAIEENISIQIPKSKRICQGDMPAFMKIMEDTARGVPYSETEFRIINSEGIYLWCRIRATTQYDAEGRAIKAVGVILDIDEEKKQKEHLIELVQHDAHTGLYNKTTINSLVEKHMKNIKQGVQCGIQALMIIDLDYFKEVNDTYGHLCGDKVLSHVAEVLKRQNRSTDYVGRIGGDEFLVYFPSMEDELAVEGKARRLLKEIQCITPREGAKPISCSIGIAVCREDIKDYYQLYHHADQALYQRKRRGRGGFSFYGQDSDTTPSN